MKNIILSLSILSFFAIGSCKKSSPAPANTANVMFVNGCAGVANVDVSANSTKVAAATNLAFMKNSGYQNITAGTDSITFVLTSTGTPLKTNTSSYTANSHYSVFIGGLVTGPSAVVLSDDLSAPASGKAKIRFVNLSNDALSVTANAGTIAFATGINAQTSSSFTEIASGAYSIKAGDPANISTVVTLGTSTTQLSSGKIYTVMLTGTLTGTGPSSLTLTLINNN